MSHIDLSREEQEMLVEVLQISLPKLEMEIDRTDSHRYKEGLKYRRDVLKQLLEKMTEPLQVAA